MKHTILGLIAGLLLSFGAGTAQADEATTAALECVQQSYTPQDRERLVALLPDFAGLEDTPAVDKMLEIIFAASDKCIEELNWNEAQAETATLYEMSRLSEVAFRKHGPLNSEELARIDAALAKGDRTRFWAILETEMMADEDAQVSATGAFVLGSFINETGLGDGDKPEQVGSLLGMMMMQRISIRDFDAN